MHFYFPVRVCFFFSQVGGTTKQTSVKKNDLSPTWDERFVFDISHETVIQLEVVCRPSCFK